MAKLNEASVALLLERIRPQFPEEAEKLSDHLDEMGGVDQAHRLIREVAAALERSNLTAASVQPVFDRGVLAMERMAVEEKRRNDLEERRQSQEHELRMTKWIKVVVPLVAGLLGILATLASQWFTIRTGLPGLAP